MFSTIFRKLSRLDLRIFAALERNSVRRPAELRAVLIALSEYGRGEISESLARLLWRGLIAELPGRRFYARIVASEPQDFTPLTVTEWAQAVN